MSTQRMAKLAAAAVASGFMTVGVVAATTGTAHADQQIDVDHQYNCNTIAGGIPLGTKLIGVNTQVTVPDTYVPGQTIPTRKLDIELTLPEDLRAQTYNLVQGRSVEGGSDNTALDLVNSGQTSKFTIENLASLAPVDVPAQPNAPFVVPAQGDVPAIPIPAQASGDTTILMPTSFFIDATIYRGTNGSGTSVPATLDCTIVTNTPAYRFVATVPEEGSTASPVAQDVTTSTDYDTPVAITLPTATDSDSAASDLTYTYSQPTDGEVTGTGQSLTYNPDADTAGPDSFTYTVTDEDGNTDTATVNVEVAKASSTTKAKPAAKRVKAGKPVRMTVTVNSEATAAGKVTVKLGRKTVASGQVRNGKATVTVAGKATKKLRGKKVFTVTYAGSAVVEGSKAKATVTFTR